MSRSSEIRGLLQVRAKTAIGFPAAVKYEGKTFEAPPTNPWARMTLTNTRRGPFSLSDSAINGGLLLVDLFYPVNKGTKAIEDAADALIDVFPIGDRIAGATLSLWIQQAYHSGVIETPTDLQVPVTVSWRCITD
ncbi:phage tail terminator-like protein [Bradyrhizobium sp. CCBAU 51753]|uniref:phage tail terminator-like protein n=1 Tax=Bradyrhizobium sp. CCBAU 51753 TaxID=1325100 RepID=UPI00188CC630|nr:phage tail terminator-like protein [Bradyrhizobium sp. CCBAU 51753]QOZ25277.1 hypothetical protein XH93_18035 [Bradyrhizobium sp. CCBAU 51753]